MSSDRPILVTGASGKTGRACLAALHRRGLAVRVLVRRDAAASELRAAGAAEAICGDMFDPAVLRRAVAGAGTVLHICPPMDGRETELAATLTDICRDEKVARLVLWSVLHPSAAVPHHRRKLAAEHALVDSGVPYTILQPGRYMEHLRPIWPELLRTGVHAMPFAVEPRFSLVDLGDLAEAAARVCAEDVHAFATYELAGPEALSQADCAAIIAGVLGRPIRAAARPLDDFLAAARRGGMAEERLATMTIMNRHYDDHGLRGSSYTLESLLGRPARRFAAFVATLPRET